MITNYFITAIDRSWSADVGAPDSVALWCCYYCPSASYRL